MRLEITGLSKNYGNQKVLKDLCLSLSEVEAPVIIGPSGGGKSTLLEILAGLILPDSGAITLNQHAFIFQENFLRDYRKKIAVVFQAYNLFPHLTALDNITLPLEKVHGFSQRQAQKTALELLERFSLTEHSHKVPAQLSGGQQQRIAIARAVSVNPEVLLFDEPTSALDPEFTSEVLDIILELRREGKEIILVTHEMGFARQVSDHIVFIAQGRILEEGPVEQIFTKPQSPELINFLDKILKY